MPKLVAREELEDDRDKAKSSEPMKGRRNCSHLAGSFSSLIVPIVLPLSEYARFDIAECGRDAISLWALNVGEEDLWVLPECAARALLGRLRAAIKALDGRRSRTLALAGRTPVSGMVA